MQIWAGMLCRDSPDGEFAIEYILFGSYMFCCRSLFCILIERHCILVFTYGIYKWWFERARDLEFQPSEMTHVLRSDSQRGGNKNKYGLLQGVRCACVCVRERETEREREGEREREREREREATGTNWTIILAKMQFSYRALAGWREKKLIKRRWNIKKVHRPGKKRRLA